MRHFQRIGQPHFVQPNLYQFARAVFDKAIRHHWVTLFEKALKRRKWFPVGEVKLKADAFYIVRRTYGPRVDQKLSPALCQWTGYKGLGWVPLAGGLEPERPGCYVPGSKSIEVLGKNPII